MTSGVTVVVPTRNEAANARELVHRLDGALRGRAAEVMFVDDGTDDLPQVVAHAAHEVAVSVRVIRRGEAVGRLGGAVVEGIRQARYGDIVVCDGDLQHPPELVPVLADVLAHHDLVVASRYAAGGRADGLVTGLRKMVSRGTGRLSKLVFPVRLRRCSDPMSGFFAVRRSVVDIDALRPRGFKILLEIVARSEPLRVAEVPFTFGERLAGQSNASMTEGLRLLRQLVVLRLSSSRTALFLLVGMSGVVPNLAVLSVLTRSGVHYIAASVVAVQAGVAWNFAGAELFVWRDRKVGRLRHRFVKYLAVGETDLLRLPFVVLLVTALGMASLPATLTTMAGAFLLRFTLADKMIYRNGPATSVLEVAAAPVICRASEEAA